MPGRARHAQRRATRTLLDTGAAGRPGRITSLDWARGVFLIVSVTTSAVLAPRPPQLVHASWSGVTAYDLIFPLFVLLSGAGLAFAYRNRVRPLVTLRRVVVLLVVGLLYNAVIAADVTLETFRVTGPLQVYSVLVAVIATLHLVLRSARAWAVTTLVAAGALAAGLWWWSTGCPTGVLTPECNPSAVIDGRLFGAHMYAAGERGHDPEGLVAIAGTFVTASVGVTAGHLAVRSRQTGGGALRLFAWAVTVAAAGAALSLVVEPMKRLWTPSFGLLTGALGVLILAVGYLLLDRSAGRRWTAVRARLSAPFVALGRNSLLVYFGSHVAFAVLSRTGGTPSWAQRIAEAVSFDADPRIAFVVLWLAAWWVLALLLHRRRIYVHA